MLGRLLFADRALSGNGSVSCASCHQPGNYFADRLAKSPSLHRDSVLKRNTPTLLYAGKQHTQFWDGRAGSLQNQVHEVIFNPLEMGGNNAALSERVLKKEKYRHLFAASFPGKRLRDMGIREVSAALSAFVTQLGDLSSPFDRYLAGESKAMTPRQVAGFNLFMGKAQCGTCHFPPYFNSLVPPLYDLSEVEIPGTPATPDFKKPVADTDRGRFAQFRIRYYDGAFKTPTVRNAAETGPYMHHGAFVTLDQVIEFYNLGGGRGIGLDVPDQTLSAKPLGLTPTETAAIKSFIESLTDKRN
nr:cytochrome c peroxidase [Hufsiella ginkgonis]